MILIDVSIDIHSILNFKSDLFGFFTAYGSEKTKIAQLTSKM